VPVLVVQTESDVLGVIGYARARQDDTDRFRLWEVAGTAHADRTIVGALADTLRASDGRGDRCGFVLEEDRDQVLDDAEPQRLG
jgi:hypothetical protein